MKFKYFKSAKNVLWPTKMVLRLKKTPQKPPKQQEHAAPVVFPALARDDLRDLVMPVMDNWQGDLHSVCITHRTRLASWLRGVWRCSASVSTAAGMRLCRKTTALASARGHSIHVAITFNPIENA